MTLSSRALAVAAAWLAEQKKGLDITVIEVGDKLRVADYFVLVTGLNRPHVRALFDELHVRLKLAGRHHRPAEGDDLAWWLLLDYGDVVVHLLQPEARAYYDLEQLYGDCPRLDWRALPVPELPLAKADAESA
jgi:ribosome-associated protein